MWCFSNTDVPQSSVAFFNYRPTHDLCYIVAFTGNAVLIGLVHDGRVLGILMKLKH